MRRFFYFLFWAVCSITTGNATAPPLQQWLDEAIQAGGGIVTIPEGEHVLAGPLVIKNAQKLVIRGLHKERCILKVAPSENDSSQAVIAIKGTGDTLEISGLTLAGRDDISPLLKIDGSSSIIKDVTVRDCLFEDFTDALSAQRIQGFSLERCSFRDGTRAIILQDSPSAKIRGNHITRTQTGIECIRSEACVFEGNEIWNCNIGISIQEGPIHRKPLIIRQNGFTRTRVGLALPQGQSLPILENNESLVKGAE